MDQSLNVGIVADPLFVGVTRPAMAFGVTYGAVLANGMVTVELFLLTRNLLALLVCLPVHGILWILCAVEPRFFELLLLHLRSRRGSRGSRAVWRASTYAPAPLRVLQGGQSLRDINAGRTGVRNIPVYVGGRV
jgi:type IV secretion system protein VirB3